MLRKLTKASRRQRDPRVTAISRKRHLTLPIARTVTGIVLLAVVVEVVDRDAPAPTSTHQVGSRPTSSAPGEAQTRDSRSTAISRAMDQLQVNPTDQQAWTRLGSAYLEQAAITGDPTYYPRAERALEHALALDPAHNWQAMIGLGALANARLDFTRGLDWARRAADVNAFTGSGYPVMIDALSRLGADPTDAIQKMLELQPGTSASIRESAYFEERGDHITARRILLRALAEATEPADLARCRYALGELAFHQGQPGAALRQYQLGLMIDPDSNALLAGRAKAEVALGRKGAALHDYATVTGRSPQPRYLLDRAELLLSLGRDDEAEQQFAVLAAEQRRLVANGVVDHLMIAVLEADHGSATTAVRHAETEWRRHRGVIVADALGWALHRAGRDREALGYAIRANRLGGRNATYRYHLGMIELALGHQAKARRDLDLALRINPYFSVRQAPVARRALIAASS
jgi:tetratricopeptide (TPR) repeat protein